MARAFAPLVRLAPLGAAGALVALALNVRAQSATPPAASPPAAPPAASPPAAPAPAAPAPPGALETAAAADAGSCHPACREGFVCSRGQCVSVCNPPCPADQMCVEGRYCDYGPRSAGGIREPLPPRRIPFASRSYSMASFHYGFPSRVDVNGAGGPRGPVLGVNMRSDVPVVEYLLVGPMFEFASYELGYYFDLDFYLRARVPIDAKSVHFQIWAGAPIGLTFDFLSGNFAPDAEGFALGWNVGVLAGGAVHFSRDFGLFTEGGWQQHKMSHDRVQGGDLDLTLEPWIWRIGFVFRG